MIAPRNKRIAVLGASLGGLVAAAELKARGFEPVLLERGKSVGGLFNKVKTPFGVQELGMHVVYATDRHLEHLATILGEDVFTVLSGPQVDVGASYNFGRTYFNSMYPCLLGHHECARALEELRATRPANHLPRDAGEELSQRFGPRAGGIVRPVLEKLWRRDASELTRESLHCFFDLRRIVVCEKEQADQLKKDPRLDEAVANPDQLRPAGAVFGGRKGLVFQKNAADLAHRVSAWAERNGVGLRFGSLVTADQNGFALDGTLLADEFAGCIVTIPLHTSAAALGAHIDFVELSLHYFQLDSKLGDRFPAYYVLCHDPSLASSRIVNYDAYNPRSDDAPSVIAVEAVHPVGEASPAKLLAAEVERVLPGIRVQGQYRLPGALTIAAPTLQNRFTLDAAQRALAAAFADKPVYFTGMRTDAGVFFSHHTMGLAYDAAVACTERLT